MWNSDMEPVRRSIRILVANEPFAYRDVLGSSLRLLRPEFQVHVPASGNLQDEIDSYDPHLVIHSRETFDLATSGRAWILLNPGGVDVARYSVKHGSEAIDSIDFGALLALIDIVAELAMTPTAGQANDAPLSR